jgi:YidC/Oxa1 family membrane protein insertase
MFAFMPLIFTFMFATFPAGLVIYYAWNNLLSVAQQAFIMKREGVDVKFFDNIKPKKLKAAND